eukprot:CAMPEP_0171265734 /NCGR_PEP_ID=MMETSP0790-20130122/58279_1 /TAXON_ID=2925 /ORGANISM="Alexandrium catenella, Strain OF101" /LENGTH=79 /DNA_ID=CAMNT_0011734415 /DNA_START=42 /DNA_END=277 /DNA_ORIENTATION=-
MTPTGGTEPSAMPSPSDHEGRVALWKSARGAVDAAVSAGLAEVRRAQRQARHGMVPAADEARQGTVLLAGVVDDAGRRG